MQHIWWAPSQICTLTSYKHIYASFWTNRETAHPKLKPGIGQKDDKCEFLLQNHSLRRAKQKFAVCVKLCADLIIYAVALLHTTRIWQNLNRCLRKTRFPFQPFQTRTWTTEKKNLLLVVIVFFYSWASWILDGSPTASSIRWYHSPIWVCSTISFPDLK